MKLIFASTNEGKIKELKMLLPQLDILSLKDINYNQPIEEPFETFEENAAQKAKTIYQQTGIPTLADDSGLCVEVLDGAPGVHSAYYGGTHGDAQKNISKLLADLQDKTNRRAHFTTVICYFNQQGPHFFTGTCEGNIAHAPQGEKGFGYDPIFIPQDTTQSFAEISREEKNKISHRAKALLLFRKAMEQHEV